MDGKTDRGRSVAAVILAAGASMRFGRPKQLLYYDGRSLLRRAAEAVANSTCRPIVAVLGAFAAPCAEELRGLRIHLTENATWTEGLGASLRTGIEAVSAVAPDAAAAVVTLCDQPFLSPQGIDALVRRYRESGAPIVASAYAGTLGVPALFDRSLFERLRSVRGDGGARRIIESFQGDVAAVPFPEGKIDIDTPQDFEALQGSAASSSRTPSPLRGGPGGEAAPAVHEER